jgi:hypothetical protein
MITIIVYLNMAAINRIKKKIREAENIELKLIYEIDSSLEESSNESSPIHKYFPKILDLHMFLRNAWYDPTIIGVLDINGSYIRYYTKERIKRLINTSDPLNELESDSCERLKGVLLMIDKYLWTPKRNIIVYNRSLYEIIAMPITDYYMDHRVKRFLELLPAPKRIPFPIYIHWTKHIMRLEELGSDGFITQAANHSHISVGKYTKEPVKGYSSKDDEIVINKCYKVHLAICDFITNWTISHPKSSIWYGIQNNRYYESKLLKTIMSYLRIIG